MPELPEIETVKRTLTPLLTGQRIEQIQILRPEPIKHPEPESFQASLTGAIVCALSRRGKYLRIHLEDGSQLVAHLRMTGRLLCVSAGEALLPHTHVIFTLGNQQQLRFSDVRRFGGFWLLAAGEEDTYTGLQKLGREPLEPGFDGAYLQTRLGNRRLAIKEGILNQTVLAGLGNIYADEALFAARLLPTRPCCTLTEAEWQALAQAIPPILQSAIDHSGTTFSDYLDGEGHRGNNQPYLQAYGRAGQPCSCCGQPLQKLRIGGRGSCFCSCCQK